MDLRIMLFATLREALGQGEIQLQVAHDPATVQQVLTALAGEYPTLQPYLPSLRVAVNHEYVGNDHPVSALDEVALIPPVSGG